MTAKSRGSARGLFAAFPHFLFSVRVVHDEPIGQVVFINVTDIRHSLSADPSTALPELLFPHFWTRIGLPLTAITVEKGLMVFDQLAGVFFLASSVLVSVILRMPFSKIASTLSL